MAPNVPALYAHMEWTPREKWLLAALVLLVLLVAGFGWYHYNWMKTNCTCKADTFTSLYGWSGSGTTGAGNVIGGPNMHVNPFDNYWPTFRAAR
jgi:hypothetical protein